MPTHDGSTDRPRRDAARESSDHSAQISFLEQEVAALRRRLADSPRQTRVLEDRLADTEAQLATVTAQNDRLATTLREARDQIVALKEEIDRLAQPPAGFGIFLSRYEDGTVDVFTGGRKLRVAVQPGRRHRRACERPGGHAQRGAQRRAAMEFERIGEIVMLKEVLADGDRGSGDRRTPTTSASCASPPRSRIR